jgi:hypothetical protein
VKSKNVRGAAPRLLVPLPSGDGRRDARAMADVVRLVVPDLVGLSLVVRDADGDDMWTVAATGDDVALLDAVQYLAGGPGADRVLPGTGWLDVGDRDAAVRWPALVTSAASLGVGAVLVVGGEDAGSSRGPTEVVHVYAGSGALGQEDRVAAALAAWAQRADGLRDTRLAVEDEPVESASLVQQGALARGVACYAVRQDLDVVAAQERVHDAALRAGVPDHHLARFLARPA